MPGALTFRLRDARHVVGRSLLPVTGLAQDLEIAHSISAAECERDDVIDIPELAG